MYEKAIEEFMKFLFNDGGAEYSEEHGGFLYTERAIESALLKFLKRKKEENNRESEAEKHYLVVWKIDIFENNPREAAKQAKITQLDTESIANVFEVNEIVDKDGNPWKPGAGAQYYRPTTIDLDEEVENEGDS